jgi:hypothetical protein
MLSASTSTDETEDSSRSNESGFDTHTDSNTLKPLSRGNSLLNDLQTIKRLLESLSPATSPSDGGHSMCAVLASVFSYLLDKATRGKWEPPLDSLVLVLARHLAHLVHTSPAIVHVIIRNNIVQDVAALVAFYATVRVTAQGPPPAVLQALVRALELLVAHVRTRRELVAVVRAFTACPAAAGPQLTPADFWRLVRLDSVPAAHAAAMNA